MNEEEIKQIVQNEVKQIVGQADVLPDSIKQRHVEGMVIFRGLAADRPDGSTEVLAYFSTDTDTLNIWNGLAWVQEVLT